jgi:hypothetical protein
MLGPQGPSRLANVSRKVELSKFFSDLMIWFDRFSASARTPLALVKSLRSNRLEWMLFTGSSFRSRGELTNDENVVDLFRPNMSSSSQTQRPRTPRLSAWWGVQPSVHPFNRGATFSRARQETRNNPDWLLEGVEFELPSDLRSTLPIRVNSLPRMKIPPNRGKCAS